MRVTVSRKETFCAAHRLNNPEWDGQKNLETFDKCNSVYYHGHNYTLIVKVTGLIDPLTGYVIDMKKLSAIVKQKVTDRFDHRNLNLEIEEFKFLNPTAENISVVIYNLLRPEIAPDLDLKIVLYETEKNFAEYPA